MSNVVTMQGSIAPEARIPNDDVIGTLKRVLEMAESGEVQNIAIAYGYADGSASRQVAGLVGNYSMVGALSVLMADVVEHHR